MSTLMTDDEALALLDKRVEVHKRLQEVDGYESQEYLKLAAVRDHFAALVKERDSLQARLGTNRCNSGHETLPLTLWDCPECHNETKRDRDALKVKADLWDSLTEARKVAAETPDDTKWKRLAREPGGANKIEAIKECRAVNGFTLREARDVVESYISERHA